MFLVMVPHRTGHIQWQLVSEHLFQEEAEAARDALISQSERDSYPSPGPIVVKKIN